MHELFEKYMNGLLWTHHSFLHWKKPIKNLQCFSCMEFLFLHSCINHNQFYSLLKHSGFSYTSSGKQITVQSIHTSLILSQLQQNTRPGMLKKVKIIHYLLHFYNTLLGGKTHHIQLQDQLLQHRVLYFQHALGNS